MKFFISALAALLTAGAAAASSTDRYGHDEVTFNPQVFAEQHRALVQEVKTGERYVELSNTDRRDVLDSLNTLGDLLADVSTIDELNNNEKLRVFNLQEQINTLLTEAAKGSRLVCARETKTGSHRSINVCKTVAQRERERDVSVEGLRGHKGAPLPRCPPGGPC